MKLSFEKLVDKLRRHEKFDTQNLLVRHFTTQKDTAKFKEWEKNTGFKNRKKNLACLFRKSWLVPAAADFGFSLPPKSAYR